MIGMRYRVRLVKNVIDTSITDFKMNFGKNDKISMR